MRLAELDRFKHVMHHHVIVTMKDGTKHEGHIQPWSEVADATVYITPMSGVGETAKLALPDISKIDVVE
jgi:hypothetical protein